jgi:uncharacterized protein
MTRKKKIFSEIPVTIESQGAQLVGLLHQSRSPKLVILCHGFTGNKIENKRLFVETARELAGEGFDAFRFDFFGSGDSEGDFADSLISHNIANLKDVIFWAQSQGYKKIAVLGISMGAATAILTLKDSPVDALVCWSAVPDMYQLFNKYVGAVSETAPGGNTFEYDGWLIRREFWEDATQYNIKAALATLAMPKFIVQGTGDAPLFVKGFHDFQEVVLPPADFMEIPDAGHTYQTPPHRRQVIRQTMIWLRRHF